MAVDYQSLAVKGVQALSPYQPGKPIDELARELGLEPSDIIKLASNENPLGPSEKALAAARSALSDLCLYPDGNGYELKRALSERYGVGMDQITLGNGSNDVLEVITPMVMLTELCGCFNRPAADARPWRVDNPLSVPTERERFTSEQELPVYRVLYQRNQEELPELAELESRWREIDNPAETVSPGP